MSRVGGLGGGTDRSLAPSQWWHEQVQLKTPQYADRPSSLAHSAQGTGQRVQGT